MHSNTKLKNINEKKTNVFILSKVREYCQLTSSLPYNYTTETAQLFICFIVWGYKSTFFVIGFQ